CLVWVLLSSLAHAALNSTVEPASVNGAAASISSGSGDSLAPVLSSDGRFVAFLSCAADLVTNGNNGTVLDLFVRDLKAAQTILVSRNYLGTAGGNGSSGTGTLSGDSRWIAFSSDASDLVTNDLNQSSDVFVRDLQTGVTMLVSENLQGNGSGNGPSVA